MDIRQLRYFVCAVQAGSVSAAADALFVTRAALSKSLSRLESELGYALVARGRDGVEPTERGVLLFPRAAALVEEFDALEAEMLRGQGERTVTICVPTSWFGHFEGCLRCFQEAYAGEIRLEVLTCTDAEVKRRFECGEADMAISHLRLSGALDEDALILRTPLYIAMSDRSALAGHDRVTEADMASQDVYYYTCGFDKVFWVPTFSGARGHFENDLMFIYERVHRNEGVLPTPLYTIPEFQSGIVFRPFEGEHDTIETFCYLSKSVRGDARLKIICQRLRRELAAEGVGA